MEIEKLDVRLWLAEQSYSVRLALCMNYLEFEVSGLVVEQSSGSGFGGPYLRELLILRRC